jgi:hypothetical protein
MTRQASKATPIGYAWMARNDMARKTITLRVGSVVHHKSKFRENESWWIVVAKTNYSINASNGSERKDFPVQGAYRLIVFEHDGRITHGWSNGNFVDFDDNYEVFHP